jgi:diguanylate cyclase (GGDEF)-like protein
MSSEPSKPAARRRSGPPVSARLGASMFLGGALVTVLSIAAAQPEHADRRGYVMLALAQVAFAGLVLCIPRSLGKHFIPGMVVLGGIVAVSAAVLLNGERDGGDALLNELYYVWPALYVGYFFRRPGIVGSLATIGVFYAGVLSLQPLDPSIAVTRWLVTVSVTTGAAFTLHAIRSQVDGLLRKLRETARTDPLTAVLNRRGFEELAERELAAAGRDGRPCALLLGDIDHFKHLNDRFGHAAGDAALASVAGLITRTCRPTDVVARIGGEEFAVLLPGASLEDAVATAERIREGVQSDTGAQHALTVSFGVASYAVHGRSLAELMAAADSALYRAKADGRDRTVLYDAEDAPGWVAGDVAGFPAPAA